MFVKGEHERQFAYEAHTACDRRGFVLGVEVTAGNVHDSVAWDKIYDNVTSKFDVQFVAMDAGYKTPWTAKNTLDDGKVPVLPYTRYTGSKDRYKPWEYCQRRLYLSLRRDIKAYHYRPEGQTNVPKHTGAVQKLPLQSKMRYE